MLPGGGWTLAGAAFLLLLAGAKAHGRQVRLERERIGVTSVVFGRPNDSRVEAIWARDRRGFWGLFAVLVVGAWGLVVAAGLRLAGTGPMISSLLILAVAFATCFVVLGLASLARLLARRPDDDPTWRRSALRGSIGWWALVAAAATLVALAF